MRIINPIGFLEDSRGFFLVDKTTLEVIEVPLEVYRRWKSIVENKISGKKRWRTEGK